MKDKKQTYYDFLDGRRVLITRNEKQKEHHGRELLGEGGSQVWCGLLVDADKKARSVAVKKVDDIKSAALEFNIHSTLDHPHIVKAFGCLNVQSKKAIRALLISEKASGTVADKISKFKGNKAACIEFLRQVALGLEYLHDTKNIMHRDIKPENILMVRDEKSGKISYKIADFGSATEIEKSGVQKFVGTPCYLAPEIASYDLHFETVDIFSLGVSVYMLFYNGFLEAATLAECRTADVLYPKGRPKENTLDRLIWDMTAKEPEKRLSLKKIIECTSEKPSSCLIA